MDEDLRVAAGREPVAGPLEAVPNLGVVVDLAVLDDLDAAVLVADRLVATVEIDDREPPRGDRRRPLRERAGAVGSAVDERRVHRGNGSGVDGLTGERDDPADPAHS